MNSLFRQLADERGDLWAHVGIDTVTPSTARMESYILNGPDPTGPHFGPDRALAASLQTVLPGLRSVLRANQRFHRRVTAYLAASGIDQFLALGYGLPRAAGNLDHVVSRLAPDAVTVLTDPDPINIAYLRTVAARPWSGQPWALRTGVVNAHPDDVLGLLHDVVEPYFARRPIAVLLTGPLGGPLPFLDDPHGTVARLLAVLPPGSRLVLTHPVPTPRLRQAAALYGRDRPPLHPAWTRGHRPVLRRRRRGPGRPTAHQPVVPASTDPRRADPRRHRPHPTRLPSARGHQMIHAHHPTSLAARHRSDPASSPERRR